MKTKRAELLPETVRVLGVILYPEPDTGEDDLPSYRGEVRWHDEVYGNFMLDQHPDAMKASRWIATADFMASGDEILPDVTECGPTYKVAAAKLATSVAKLIQERVQLLAVIRDGKASRPRKPKRGKARARGKAPRRGRAT